MRGEGWFVRFVPARRAAAAVVAAAAAAALAGCAGSSRTALPEQPASATRSDAAEPAAPGASAISATSSTVAAGPSTTVSGWVTAGMKHPLPGGGTVSASYPRSQVKPPPGVPAVAPERAYAYVTVKLCAPAAAPVPGELVRAARFAVEVPGQGYVRWTPETPVVRGPPLPDGTEIPAGGCVQGVISYVIAGEQHIEAITYDRGDGLLRWAA